MENQNETEQQFVERKDAYVNHITGQGIIYRDKSMSSIPVLSFITQDLANRYYQSNDIAARVIDRLPEEMFREGYKIIVEDDPELSNKIQQRIDEFEINKKIESAIKFARLYGGSSFLVGIKNQAPELPLDLKNLYGFDFCFAFDRYELIADFSSIDKDVKSKNFRMPTHYTFNEVDYNKSNERIHHTRLYRFDGVELPMHLMRLNGYWGDSVLSRITKAITNFITSYDNTALLVHDFAPVIFKMRGLSTLIANGKKDLVEKRLELALRGASNINGIVIEEGEEYERKTTTITGLAEILDKMGNRLVSATDMPHTILLGESPSASNGTGNSTTLSWFDHVKNKQKSLLEPALNWIIDILFSDKSWITNGVIPNYKIEFNPLWQLDLKEEAEIRKIMADTDAIYVDRAIVTSDEIRENRFGKDGFSIETNIDHELTKSFNEGEDQENLKE